MLSLPQINTLKPVTIPARSEQIYDRWYIVSLVVDGQDPSNTVAIAKLRKCGTDADGNTVFHPTEPERAIRVDNVFLEATTNSNLANALGLIVLVVSDMILDQELCELVALPLSNIQNISNTIDNMKSAMNGLKSVALNAMAENDIATVTRVKEEAQNIINVTEGVILEANELYNDMILKLNGSTLPKVTNLVNIGLNTKDELNNSINEITSINVIIQSLGV